MAAMYIHTAPTIQTYDYNPNTNIVKGVGEKK